MPEPSGQAFIVRIWFEPREIPESPALWRGLVQHVQSGDKGHFNRFEELVEFIILKSEFASKEGEPQEGPGPPITKE